MVSGWSSPNSLSLITSALAWRTAAWTKSPVWYSTTASRLKALAQQAFWALPHTATILLSADVLAMTASSSFPLSSKPLACSSSSLASVDWNCRHLTTGKKDTMSEARKGLPDAKL